MALTDSLEAYYAMDEASGTVLDSTANNHDSTTENGITYGATGNNGDAISFDGTDDYIGIPDSAGLDVGTGAWSFNVWVNLDDNGDAILGKHDPDSPYNTGWLLRTNGATGVANVVFQGSTVVSATTDITSTGWTMITFTRDGSGNIEIYIDGSSENTATGHSTDLSDGEELRFGHGTGFNSYYGGDMQHFGLWTKELSSSEVSELYASGAGNPYPFTSNTGLQINIGDVWKETPLMKINIGDVWKDVSGAQINIGDVWKTIF